MRRIHALILLALPLLLILTAAAPSRKKAALPEFDLEEVKATVTDPRSPLSWEKLMERFEADDTTMTLEEYRYLYFGTIFQEDFNPYRHSAYADRIAPLTHQSTHTRAELDTLAKYTQKALLDTPFDLNQINFLIYALRAKGKVNLADIWQYRLNNLLKAIVTTGSGSDTTAAWYVIYPRDEATIVNMGKDVVSLAPRFVEPYYDCIEVTDRQGKTQSFYFNILPLLEQYYVKFPE